MLLFIESDDLHLNPKPTHPIDVDSRFRVPPPSTQR